MRPVRITRLELKDIGAFDDAVLNFPLPAGKGELVLFEGPNGSGKTTIIDAIAWLISRNPKGNESTSRIVSVSSRYIRPGSGSASITIEHMSSVLTAHESQEHNQSSKVTWSASDNDVARAIDACVHGDSGKSPLGWAAFRYIPHEESNYQEADGNKTLSKTATLGSLGGRDKSTRPGLEILQMAVNLENERATNHQYAREKPNERQAREEAAESSRVALKDLETGLSRILGRAVTFGFLDNYRRAQILIDGVSIRPEYLGEGMRSTLAWITDLLVRLYRVQWARADISPWHQEFWLLLDEIEESLHPKRQMELLPALRELFPNARIYAATHSPFVVASVGEGHVFSIRPDPKTGRVRGSIEVVPLEHGQSLDWVVKNVFDIRSKFMDANTIRDLAQHEADVGALIRAGDLTDWDAFLKRRDSLMSINAHVATIVLMRELPVREFIDAQVAIAR